MRRAPLALLLAILTQDCVSLPVQASQRPECAPIELAQVVTIFGEWSLHHVPLPEVTTPLGTVTTYGAANAQHRVVLIEVDAPEPIRRLAVIHELEHVLMFRAGIPAQKHDDARVRRCAIREYKRLFGGDLDLPEVLREAALGQRR